MRAREGGGERVSGREREGGGESVEVGKGGNGGDRGLETGGGPHAHCAGFGYNDEADNCDCKVIKYVDAPGKDDPSTIGNTEDGSPSP